MSDTNEWLLSTKIRTIKEYADKYNMKLLSLELSPEDRRTLLRDVILNGTLRPDLFREAKSENSSWYYLGIKIVEGKCEKCGK